MRILGAIILLLSSVSTAAPMVYTFEGTVGENGWTLQYRVGDPIRYQFLLDFDRPGEIWDGETVEPITTATLDDGTYHYFYAELLDGTILDWTGSYTGPRSHVGITRYTNGVLTLSALLSYTDDPFRNFVWVPSDPCCKDIRQWAIGDHFSGDNEVHRGEERHYGDGSSAWIYSSLYLVSIEPHTEAVPEPATIVLFAVAAGILAGHAGIGRLVRRSSEAGSDKKSRKS